MVSSQSNEQTLATRTGGACVVPVITKKHCQSCMNDRLQRALSGCAQPAGVPTENQRKHVP